MIITTTNTVPGHEIAEYKGLATGEVVAGVNLIKDLGAGLKNIFGGRSSGYEGEIIEARNKVIEKVKRSAEELGADAVVGLKLDVESKDAHSGGMIFVTAIGTAVKLK
ncbi:MAG: YbjQ family protein [Gemella sp.]|nr:YbjQ family protein [Gemella sp.]